MPNIYLSMSEVRKDQFPEAVNRVKYNKDRVILKKHNTEVAVIVSLEDLQILERLEDSIDSHEAILALKKAKKQTRVSLEELKKDLGIG